MFTLEGRSIVVTGGTGSFGHKFVETMLSLRPRRLSIFSRDEWKQSEMNRLFPRSQYPFMRYRLGDVRDYVRLREVFRDTDIVIHAAAQKQVPASEHNPFEAVSTNVIGSQNVIRAAIDNGVRRVVFLSSDKAVDPINLYGCTKMCAEKLFTCGSIMSGHETLCSVVRYGNVFGSRGSVVPLWLSQVKSEGRITMTDGAATRFWITLDSAVKLVMDAVKYMLGGEVFIPKLRSSTMAALSRAIAPDLPVETIGMRPGEKMHERLISPFDDGEIYELPECYAILPNQYWYDSVMRARWPRRGAVPVRIGRSFVSGPNRGDYLTVDELRKMLEQYKGA